MPGVDHQDNFLGAVHDVTLRIGLVNWIVRNLDADQMDVETAFSEGALEEKERVHMKCPPGMTPGKDECLVMCKGMCGLVQSARLHLLKMSKILMSSEVGFRKSEADQCSFVKVGVKGPVTRLLCVDDSCMFGHKFDIEKAANAVRKHFTIETEGGLKDFRL